MVEQLDPNEIIQVIKRMEPVISYSSLQTRMENRDDLKQHLYEVTIKTLKIRFLYNQKDCLNE